jgi:exodeoxyribonuclease-1
MAIIVYDLETTGLKPKFDQPTQFAAVRLDETFNEIEAVNIFARPQNHVIASPKALVKQRRGIEEILSASVSHYALMGRIEALAAAWRPAIWWGYSSRRFDDEMLRHSLYASLRQPYVIQFHGNRRGDVLYAARFANALNPGILTVPLNEKQVDTFALEKLAPANGFTGHQAHDALGDARAAAFIMRLIAARAPATWRLLVDLTDKTAVLDLLEDSDFVLLMQGARARPVVPIGLDPDGRNEVWALELHADPAPLRSLEPQELKGARLRRIRLNAMPLIVPPDHPAAAPFVANIAGEVPRWARTVSTDGGLCERLLEAGKLARRLFPEAVDVEDQLYEAFFPQRDDKGLCANFHIVDPARKRALLELMRDDRARQLGCRILYNEWPDVLSHDERAAMDQKRLARMHAADGVPWMTIAKALAEIDTLLPTAAPLAAKILADYRTYLSGASQ